MRARGCSAIVALLAACGENGSFPEGRLTSLSAPQTDDEARRAGCFSSGSKAGAGFGAVLRAASDLRWDLLLQASNYDGVGSIFSLRFLPSEAVISGVTIDENFWTEAYADRLVLPEASISGGYVFAPELLGAAFSGKLYTDELGLTVDALLSGYVTRDYLQAEVEKYVAGRGGSAGAVIARLLELSGGFDARYQDGVPSACIDDECNALSVCLMLDAEPINLP